LKKYDEKRKEQFDKTYEKGDLVEFIKGPIKVDGNEKYNPNRWSGIYEIIDVKPSKLNYDLKNINNEKNINIKKIIPYHDQVDEKQSHESFETTDKLSKQQI
jgi:hypothetical protein